MTYEQAKKEGYKVTDYKYQRGYISRKVDLDKQPVHIAGGNRRGELYVLAPCWETSSFCKRVYLAK